MSLQCGCLISQRGKLRASLANCKSTEDWTSFAWRIIKSLVSAYFIYEYMYCWYEKCEWTLISVFYNVIAITCNFTFRWKIFFKKVMGFWNFIFRRRSRQEKIIFKEHPSILTHDLLIDSFFSCKLGSSRISWKKVQFCTFHDIAFRDVSVFPIYLVKLVLYEFTILSVKLKISWDILPLTRKVI